MKIGIILMAVLTVSLSFGAEEPTTPPSSSRRRSAEPPPLRTRASERREARDILDEVLQRIREFENRPAIDATPAVVTGLNAQLALRRDLMPHNDQARRAYQEAHNRIEALAHRRAAVLAPPVVEQVRRPASPVDIREDAPFIPEAEPQGPLFGRAAFR